MQRQRDRPIPRWLTDRTNRRALALVPAAAFALGAVAAAYADDALGIALMLLVALGGLAASLLLRRATQMLDTTPPGLLDEREVELRHRAHQLGYHLTLALLAVLWALAVVDGLLGRTTGTDLFSDEGWMLLILETVLVVSMLPAAALAWIWQPLPDDDDA